MPYSPSRRTALVLCGTGAHGAYHAGVLRALQEAGVKIDVVAGQGVGAAGAMLAAIDGGSRLWDADGIWRSGRGAHFYAWTARIQVAAWAALLLIATLFIGIVVQAAGITAGGSVTIVLAGLATVCALTAGGALLAARFRGVPGARRAEGPAWWSLVGAPCDAGATIGAFTDTVWHLIRGASREDATSRVAGQRYADMLAENLGQPGFRELMMIATDLDARSDVVVAMLREPYRREFMAPRQGRERRAEALDLAGHGRDHAFDVMAAALTPPSICEPALVAFPPDGYWRGETHRLCDRPGSIVRLLDELARAGVSQLIVATAVAVAPSPHRLRASRLDMRGRLGEFIAASEAASLRDASEVAQLRFDSFYVVCPSHNPVGPFDCAGAYDGASDRRHSIGELLERGYEDAYRQFIEPVVGASGEHLARADAPESSPLG